MSENRIEQPTESIGSRLSKWIMRSEIATLEKAARLVCPWCPEGGPPEPVSVCNGRSTELWHKGPRGSQTCLAQAIHAEIARLRAEIGEKG